MFQALCWRECFFVLLQHQCGTLTAPMWYSCSTPIYTTYSTYFCHSGRTQCTFRTTVPSAAEQTQISENHKATILGSFLKISAADHSSRLYNSIAWLDQRSGWSLSPPFQACCKETLSAASHSFMDISLMQAQASSICSGPHPADIFPRHQFSESGAWKKLP